jgi:hypothetical protein
MFGLQQGTGVAAFAVQFIPKVWCGKRWPPTKQALNLVPRKKNHHWQREKGAGDFPVAGRRPAPEKNDGRRPAPEKKRRLL